MSARPGTATAQLKVRLREPLRAALDLSAKERQTSLNTEIVRRLEGSMDHHERDVAATYEALDEALLKLNELQGEFHALVSKSREPEVQSQVIQIASNLLPVQRKILKALEALVPVTAKAITARAEP
jgi:hypothetical protein